MNPTWVVVAESSRARIFAMDRRNGPMRELEDLTNPGGRAHMQELVSDRPGRSFAGKDKRHALEPTVEAKREGIIRFAKSLADRVEQGRTHGKFDELVLIASPEFLGLLRQNLTAATEKCLQKTLDKNLLHLDEAGIRRRIFGA